MVGLERNQMIGNETHVILNGRLVLALRALAILVVHIDGARMDRLTG